jgi:hypothetical protein
MRVRIAAFGLPAIRLKPGMRFRRAPIIVRSESIGDPAPFDNFDRATERFDGQNAPTRR